MSRKKRIRICFLLIAVNLAFIWGNSLLSGEVSGQISGGLLAWLKSRIAGLGMGEHLLRKLGHFSEFTALGFLTAELFLLQGERGGHCVTSPLLTGLLAACTDETIQRFVDGRGSSLIDVWIDTAGVMTGIGVLFAVQMLITQIKEKRK